MPRTIGLVATSLAMLVLLSCSNGDAEVTDDAGAGTTNESARTSASTEPDGELQITDFEAACRGDAVPGANEYDAADAGVHPVIAFAGASDVYERTAVPLIRDREWEPPKDALQETELVACLDREVETITETCTNYSDPDRPGIPRTVQVYDVKYNMRLVEAATGTLVDEIEVDAKGGACPESITLQGDAPVVPYYPIGLDQLEPWLAEHAET